MKVFLSSIKSHESQFVSNLPVASGVVAKVVCFHGYVTQFALRLECFISSTQTLTPCTSQSLWLSSFSLSSRTSCFIKDPHHHERTPLREQAPDRRTLVLPPGHRLGLPDQIFATWSVGRSFAADWTGRHTNAFRISPGAEPEPVHDSHRMPGLGAY
jgi:hypothetical protein